MVFIEILSSSGIVRQYATAVTFTRPSIAAVPLSTKVNGVKQRLNQPQLTQVQPVRSTSFFNKCKSSNFRHSDPYPFELFIDFRIGVFLTILYFIVFLCCQIVSVPADQLWKGVTSVSNAGKKRGRGKGVGKKMAKNLNRGQMIGVGKALQFSLSLFCLIFAFFLLLKVVGNLNIFILSVMYFFGIYE